MNDYAAMLWASAADSHRKEHGDCPSPSPHDMWPEFLELGRIAGQRIKTLLGKVQ
jgi:hypothetical protein